MQHNQSFDLFVRVPGALFWSVHFSDRSRLEPRPYSCIPVAWLFFNIGQGFVAVVVLSLYRKSEG